MAVSPPKYRDGLRAGNEIRPGSSSTKRGVNVSTARPARTRAPRPAGRPLRPSGPGNAPSASRRRKPDVTLSCGRFGRRRDHDEPPFTALHDRDRRATQRGITGAARRPARPDTTGRRCARPSRQPRARASRLRRARRDHAAAGRRHARAGRARRAHPGPDPGRADRALGTQAKRGLGRPRSHRHQHRRFAFGQQPPRVSHPGVRRHLGEHDTDPVEQRGGHRSPAGGGHPPDHGEPLERDPGFSCRQPPRLASSSIAAAHPPAAVAAASWSATDVAPAPGSPSTATTVPRWMAPPGSSSPSGPGTTRTRSPASTTGRACRAALSRCSRDRSSRARGAARATTGP